MDTPQNHPTLSLPVPMIEQNRRLAEIVSRERNRLGRFIRRRVPDSGEAEDILQDVFSELVEAYRLPEPIEQVGAWLFRVARNRITDRFRKKREESLPLAPAAGEDEEEDDGDWLGQALPALDGGPEASLARAVLLEAISEALDELPANEREVFIAHELEGKSFKDMALRSGVKLNTLLTWKRRAVRHLRLRLQASYDELF
ncbi:MAG: sigma-70 family RNA polymerase sigma factor [Candidatus Accumulibacter sp.]|jgi:RNA polymerase sigma factor (sigma-70 family)|nr:sigma-70 family RNA polymerase sigma factor [Accumulibacter sp.]